MFNKIMFGVCMAMVTAGCGTIMDTGNIGNAAEKPEKDPNEQM